jgi:DNA-binding NarL/FixJ family response regulator
MAPQGAAGEGVRVVIVDDHAVFAQALESALQAIPGIVGAGVAYSLAAGLDLVARAQPDVAVVDYRLPDGTGSDLIRGSRTAAADLRVVVLTASADEAAFLDSLEAGCAGYVTKDRPLEEVVSAVEAAAAGELAVSPSMLGRVLPRLHREAIEGSPLTAREREILALVAEGHANKTIATKLGLRLNTVRNHVQRVLTKLGAHSKLEAVAVATRQGLLRSPTEI